MSLISFRFFQPVVPKSEPGQYRLIQHLSYPEKTSINDGITEWCKL